MLEATKLWKKICYAQAKLWNSNHRRPHVLPDLEATLSDLGLDYVDNFVLHWPMACPALPGGDPEGKTRLRTGGCGPGKCHREKSSQISPDIAQAQKL